MIDHANSLKLKVNRLKTSTKVDAVSLCKETESNFENSLASSSLIVSVSNDLTNLTYISTSLRQNANILVKNQPSLISLAQSKYLSQSDTSFAHDEIVVPFSKWQLSQILSLQYLQEASKSYILDLSQPILKAKTFKPQQEIKQIEPEKRKVSKLLVKTKSTQIPK